MLSLRGSRPTRGGATIDGTVLRVAHLLVRGDVDGIGLHVADLARAQLDHGAVAPTVFTSPSPEYARRLARAGLPSTHEYRMRDVGRRGFHLLHLHGYRASRRHLLRPRPRGLPVVATCHGFAQGTLRRRVRTRLELRSYRPLKLVLTASAEQAARIGAACPAVPVEYIPNGVPVGPATDPAARRRLRARFGLPGDCDVVASIGRLAPEKRPDLFVAAAERILRARPGAYFVLFGEGPERPRLERLVRGRGLASRVLFAGLVADVPEVCAGLSLVLHCSDTEGTPRAVLHAMGAGVPVVATAVGGVPQLITDGVEGALVPRGDAGALARAALRLLADPGARERSGRRARERACAEFTVDAMRRRTEAAYRRALAVPR